jgi:protein gp37
MSAIEWTDATWNPVVGCDKVSPGCAHCYAETMAKRLRAMAQADIAAGRDPGRKKHYVDAVDDLGRWTGKLIPVPEALAEPLTWKKPRMVFVNSMSDLFHESVAFEFIAAVFGVMAACPQHSFQVLTKRAQRMCEWFGWMATVGGVGKYIRSDFGRPQLRGFFDAVAKSETVDGQRQRTLADPWMQVMNGAACTGPGPIGNVWLGVSCEDQRRADERIPWLLKTPAAVRFVSAEPLLGPINFGLVLSKDWIIDALDGEWKRHARDIESNDEECHKGGPHLDWVIVGGESGSGARPCDIAWIRSIVDQCKSAKVPCFVKQLGTITAQLSRRKGKGGDPAEWPEDLRVRQFPREVA